MGESSTEANVLLLLSALERVLPRCGYAVRPGVRVEAAARTLSRLVR
jgi:aspartate aminotransferase-like enzyme